MFIDPTQMYKWFGLLGEQRTITITSHKNAGDDPPVTCTKAIRGKVGWRVMQMLSAAYVRPDVAYSVPVALAPGPWKPGDIVADANQTDATNQTSPGVTYVVQLAEQDEGFWMLYCFNPKLSFNLKDTGDVLVTTETLGALGQRTITTAAAYANQDCRIQPSRSSWTVRHNRVGDAKLFDVFMAVDIDIQPSKHLFAWPATTNTYVADIVDVTSRESISDLMQLTVELRPGASGTL